MNSLQAAAAEAFVEILRDAGVPVTIGSKDDQAMVSPSGLAVDLEEGGFTQDGALTVRLLVAYLPIPLPGHVAVPLPFDVQCWAFDVRCSKTADGGDPHRPSNAHG
jgi:hypothetical protein